MLSKEKIEEFRAIVKKRFPDFERVKYPLGVTMSTALQPGGQVDMLTGKETFERGDSVVYIPATHRLCSCCGVLGVQEKDMPVAPAEMHGLYGLSNMSQLQIALFALWLNDNPKTWHSALIVVSASRGQGLDASERILQKVGFEPMHRSNNPNHGLRYDNSNITVWLFQTKANVPATPDQTFLKPISLEPVKKARKRVISKKD